MGRDDRTGCAQRKVLSLLRGALPGHFLLLGVEAKIPLLHGQRHHPLRGHFIPLSARIPLALRLRREGRLNLDYNAKKQPKGSTQQS